MKHVFFFFLIILLLSSLSDTDCRADLLPDRPQEKPAPYQIWTEPLTGIEFSWMPASCFSLGDNEVNMNQHQTPVHTVCLDGFWIGRHEVTNGQYRLFRPKHDSGGLGNDTLNNDEQPVAQVSWYQAGEYADWLTRQMIGTLTFRLPTEAEWEYSCRAGSMETGFPPREESNLCRYANVADRMYQLKRVKYHDCSDGAILSSPVGNFAPNPAGLYDMLGNVWEWCEDRYGRHAYKHHAQKNPVYRTVENDVDYRVIRGGSWLSEPNSVRCDKRRFSPPQSTFNVLGFRLVMTPDQQQEHKLKK